MVLTLWMWWCIHNNIISIWNIDIKWKKLKSWILNSFCCSVNSSKNYIPWRVSIHWNFSDSRWFSQNEKIQISAETCNYFFEFTVIRQHDSIMLLKRVRFAYSDVENRIFYGPISVNFMDWRPLQSIMFRMEIRKSSHLTTSFNSRNLNQVNNPWGRHLNPRRWSSILFFSWPLGVTSSTHLMPSSGLNTQSNDRKVYDQILRIHFIVIIFHSAVSYGLFFVNWVEIMVLFFYFLEDRSSKFIGHWIGFFQWLFHTKGNIHMGWNHFSFN